MINMSEYTYLSTGEAAKVLNISRSTVSRRFDSGQLDGKLNPITGERLISRKSVEDTIKKHNLTVEIPFSGAKRVLLGTADQEMASMIATTIGDDSRLQLEVVAQGSDTLIACSKSIPNLLIVDDQLPDLRGSHIVKSLRKYVDMERMKILYCGRGIGAATNGNGASVMGADALLDMNRDVDRTTLRETIYGLLSLPSDVLEQKGAHEHRRRWPRFPVDLGAQLAVFPNARPSERIFGQARIENISRGGAYLKDIHFENAGLPGEPFRLFLSVDEGRLKDWNAQCKVMRFQSNGSLSAGVEFEEISADNRQKIAKIQTA